MGLRLLHVIPSLNPAGGGPIETLRRVSPVLRTMGHDVDVVTLDPPDAPWLTGFEGTVYAMGPIWMRYGYTPRLYPWLRSHASDYDAVVVRGVWQYHSFCVWRALARASTPYFVFTHGMLDPWFKRRYPLKHLKKWMYWPWAEYRVLRDATAVLFTSEEEQRVSRQSFWLYRCNGVVVNYGTEDPGGEPRKQLKAFQTCHPELTDKRLMLFLGRIHPKKGCDVLIEAFARVAGEHPKAHLVMAGPDQVGWRPELERLAARLGIAGRITWSGMLTDEVKWGAMRAAEAMVLPSHQENFGLAVAEALACGVPVLISDKVNIWREVLADGAGLVAEDNVESTAGLLQHWMHLDELEQRRMRERARRCFKTRFEISRAAQSLVNSISSLMDYANGRHKAVAS